MLFLCKRNFLYNYKQKPVYSRRSSADYSAEPRILYHASKREHGALRCGIARHAQRSKTLMDVGNLPGCAAVVAYKYRLVRMTAENFGKCFGNIEHTFRHEHENDPQGIHIILVHQAPGDVARGLLRTMLLNGGPGVDGITHWGP